MHQNESLCISGTLSILASHKDFRRNVCNRLHEACALPLSWHVGGGLRGGTAKSSAGRLQRSGRFNAMLVNDLILTDDSPGDTASRPVVLDRSRTADAERMNHLIGSGQVRSLHDAIDRQIHELLCVRARRCDLTPEELAAGRERLLDGADPAQYGRWIFYPWSARLVHVLPPAEFAEVRLDRNRHQVTD